MNNPYAKVLAAAAYKYAVRYRDAGLDTSIMTQDVEDLMSIAQLIEDGAAPGTVARAMWRLDTAVRDEIPDSVYHHFCK